MIKKINAYIEFWESKCYKEIPDEVPLVLQNENLAPSYKAIALAILKNDHSLESLGFQNKFKSDYYDLLKKIELESKGKIKKETQLYLNFGGKI